MRQQGLRAPEHSIHCHFGTRGIEERNPIWASCVALDLHAFDPKFLSVSLREQPAAESIVKEIDVLIFAPRRRAPHIRADTPGALRKRRRGMSS